MKVGTCNIRGWTPLNNVRVRSLLIVSDVLVINEVWTPQPDNDLGVYLSLEPPTQNRTLSGGGVAIITENGTSMRHLTTFSRPKFQLASVSGFGTKIVGEYLSPTCTPEYLDYFL